MVARPTYARTMQIEHSHLPEHLTGTLPSTVNAKGVTISNVVHPAFRNQDGANNVNFANSNIGDTGSFQPGEFGEISSPSTRSRTNNNKVVEIDVPGGNKGRLNGHSVGFVSAPVSPERSVRSLVSNNGERERTGEHFTQFKGEMQLPQTRSFVVLTNVRLSFSNNVLSILSILSIFPFFHGTCRSLLPR